MAWSFNVFTGNLDQTGSGAVVFEGEVETFADLPEVVGDPPVGSSYLVRTSTGVWLVNRRQSGIWIRKNNTGIRATDWEYGGDYPVNSVAGKTGNVSLNKSDVGLGNVDNTSDANKPISAATQTALDGKAASVHTHTASQISDSTSTGRSVLTAADAAAARSAISAQVAGSYAAASHAHAASDVTSGTFDNARVNFAAPAAIGSTSPAAGSFTNLSASAELTVPAVSPASPSAGDIYRNANTLRYRDGTNTERLLLNATDNLSNLANTATARANLGLGDWATLSDGATLRSQFLTISDGESLDYIQFTASSGVTFNGNRAAQFRGALGLGTSNNVTFGSLTANNGTLPAASAPVLDLAQTWNNSGVTFTALRVNATDTASAAASNLADFQVGGTSVTAIRKDGSIRFQSGDRTLLSHPSFAVSSTAGGAWFGVNTTVSINGGVRSVGGTLAILTAQSTEAVILDRDAANTFAQRNGVAAQEYRLYGTFTSSTNYQRMTIKSVRQTLSALSGASATTTGTFIPDGAIVVGVTTRVATALTGATGYTIGDGTDADRWGDITGTAIGTTSDNINWTAGTIECFTAGGNVTLTAKTSNFTAGAVEICVFYLAGEAD